MSSCTKIEQAQHAAAHEAFVGEIGGAETLFCRHEKTPAEALAVQDASGTGFAAAYDGYVLPPTRIEALCSDESKRVPVIIGNVRYEIRVFA